MTQRVLFFSEFSDIIGNSNGYDLTCIPRPNELIYIGLCPYTVLNRSFHINSSGEHEVFITLKELYGSANSPFENKEPRP